MAPASCIDGASPLVGFLLRDLGITPGTLDLTVDPRDEMLEFLVDSHDGDREQALFRYFRSGASIADSLLQVLRWRFGSPGKITKLLDFASGYGRVTRFLVREIPAERIWAADIYAEGVRFQEETFGAHGIVSTTRPEDFSCAERFDAILVTSLFTHLPEERFISWLRVLLGLLAPGGILAFSTHSPRVLPAGMIMSEPGIHFQATSESSSLDKNDYGSTWVTAEFVRTALDRAGSPEASLHRIERALCNFQDLYLVTAEPDLDFCSLSFQGEPQLFLDRARLTEMGRQLELRGWAAVPSGSIRTIEVMLDDERLTTISKFDPRPDVASFLGDEGSLYSGWSSSCSIPAGVSHSTAVLRLLVVDGRGISWPLWAGPIETMRRVGSQSELEELYHVLREKEEELSTIQSRASTTIEALTARIQAMEASRFWKLRNAWFLVKRRLRLTNER
ncbi:MAG: class I SAM-dependent methyltransferase [Thermoanaerobaculia bacterium]